MDGEYLNQSHWRKSSQWFSLSRSHAQLLVQDRYVKPRFQKFCNGYRDGQFCVPDEHYVPTTLAVYGAQSEVTSPKAPPLYKS